MKIFRPFENESNKYLIDELHKLNNSNGMFFPFALASSIIALFWIYIRIAFWITISLVILLLILEIFNVNKYDKKKLIEKELNYRKIKR